MEGEIVDDRNCIVTDRDDGAGRLSIFPDYLLAPGGMQVFATYQAHQAPNGCRYTIDCHTRMVIDMPADGNLADAIEERRAGFDSGLHGYLTSVRDALEQTR